MAKKQFSTIRKSLETTIKKIDLDNVEFGEVKMDEESKEFNLTTQHEINELVNYLQTFIDNIQEKSSKYKSVKVNEKILETLKSETHDGELLRRIFND
ncbi:hypothetical protein BU002_02275 [Mammaliicoccus sciuri]|uniref:hypothetical protein n=1 Tax=Mammaliicoccus sciuri TaxID=1296 RepID=UPI000E684BAF|nr:hypothetical protein [Mammaliicoccus sciuri]RIN97167.1 hypothetical protein BU002_02275 [Mammaliicoccus sciuri]